MLIRAEFEKLEEIKYISHLELMTTFRRAFRRAKLPLAYSKGFNPHIQLA
ncbi:MAG: TIGR03936 family radical SAM-associated protein, partial [Halanaerobiales bacterium]